MPAQREEREQPRATMVERTPEARSVGLRWAPMPLAGRSRGDAPRVRVWRQTRHESSLVHGALTPGTLTRSWIYNHFSINVAKKRIRLFVLSTHLKTLKRKSQEP